MNFVLIFIGDSAYPIQPWLLTPLRTPITRLEKTYNRRHKTARSKVETSIGVFKNTFRLYIF